MDYPREFPKESRAKVEAEKIRAGRDFETAVKGARWRADTEKHLRTYILRVFLVFGIEARDRRLWPVDEMDRRCREFLRRLTIEARFQKGHGRDLGNMISNWNGSILAEVQAEFETSPEWKRYEDLLLEVAEAQTGDSDSTGLPRTESPENPAEEAAKAPEHFQALPALDGLPPELPDDHRREIRAGLLRIHSKFIERRATKEECVQSAYNVFAEILAGHGSPLTEVLLRVDIPGWVFAWAVSREWLEYPPYQTASGSRKRPITGYTSAVEPVPEAEMTEILGRHKTTTWHKTKILKMLEGRITYWEAEALIRKGSFANEEDAVHRPPTFQGKQASAELPVLHLETDNTADERAESADRDIPRQSSIQPDRVFRKSGDFWQLAFGGKSVHVKHRKGMTYVLHLLRAPGQEIHSMQLLTAETGRREQPEMGSAGEVLDQTAIKQYRDRIEDLQDQLAEAERNNDQGRKESAQSEMERLAEQIAGGVGLGGRGRKASDDAERFRKGVSMAIDRAVCSIREHHVAMADHLRLHIKCGSFFCYRPDDIPWDF